MLLKKNAKLGELRNEYREISNLLLLSWIEEEEKEELNTT